MENLPDYSEQFEGDQQTMYNAAYLVANHMWHRGWLSGDIQEGPIEVISQKGHKLSGITIGVFPNEYELESPALLSEAMAYPTEGFINVQMHRAIVLPLLNPDVQRTDRDSLLSLRVTYDPRKAEPSLPLEGWLPQNVELLQTFPSVYGIRDVVRMAYNPNSFIGRADIQRMGRTYFEFGFGFYRKQGNLVIDDREKWLRNIPQEAVYGNVSYTSILDMMNVLDTNLLPLATNEDAFKNAVFHVLNPQLYIR